jgi:hypothetical protein
MCCTGLLCARDLVEASQDLAPLRPGSAGDVQRRPVPRRGWECWTLEMAGHLISKRLLEVISNRSAGNGRSPGNRPFPDFQGHFYGHEGGRLDMPHWGWGKAPTSVSHPGQSRFVLGSARNNDLDAGVRAGVPESLRSPLHLLHASSNRGSVRRRISASAPSVSRAPTKITPTSRFG